MEKNLKSKQRKLRLIFLKLSGFHLHLYQATHTSSCLLSCWPHRNICPGLQNHHSQPHLHHCFYIIIDSGIMRCPAGDEETLVEMLLLNHGDILGMAEERREVHTAQEQAIHHWVIEFYEEALNISAGKLLSTSSHYLSNIFKPFLLLGEHCHDLLHQEVLLATLEKIMMPGGVEVAELKMWLLTWSHVKDFYIWLQDRKICVLGLYRYSSLL